MIVSRTPLRLSLGGGGTDLPFYCSQFGSSLLCGAINKYVYVTASPRMESKIKLNYSKTELVERVEDIEHPLIREALKLVGIDNSIEIHSVADLASGTGLGSSQSFLVGLLNALYYFKGERMPEYKLAEDASTITMDVLGEPCGKQDQYAAAFGSLLHLSISRQQEVIVSHINVKPEDLSALERNLMLFYTGINRSANEILGEQKKLADSQAKPAGKGRQNSGEKDSKGIVEHYHKIQRIGDESLASLKKGDLKRFGELMDDHWQTKKNAFGKMSNPQIDSWYELAKENGALGGKVIGAGGGGFMLFYVDSEHDKFAKAMQKQGLQRAPFQFDFEGSRIVYDGRIFEKN